MNGELAELIALVAYGNPALLDEHAPALIPANVIGFKSVRTVAFEWADDDRLTEVADNVGDWYSWLRSHGIRRLRLRTGGEPGPLPDHVAVAFAGAADWGILAEAGDGSLQSWISRWTVIQGRREQPWAVRHVGRPATALLPDTESDLASAAEILASALRSAVELARVMGEGNWHAWFADALRRLSSNEPGAGPHDDALPPIGFSQQARQLFTGAAASWAFGGMGSWNDVYVSDSTLRERFTQVSSELYRAILRSHTAVLDSWQPSPQT